jgi:hypothetical protein
LSPSALKDSLVSMQQWLKNTSNVDKIV